MKSEAEQQADYFRRHAIGPVGAVVAFALGRPDVFFKVRWTRELKLVHEAITHHENLDSTSQWAYFKTDTVSCALALEWPDALPGKTLILFFELPKFRTELELVAQSGNLVLVPEDWTIFDPGITVDAEVDPMMHTMVLNRV